MKQFSKNFDLDGMIFISFISYQPKGEKETIYLSTTFVWISSGNIAELARILSIQEKAQKSAKFAGYNM